MSETITRIADEDMPKVPQDATPEQVRVWLDEQCGLTPAIAQSLIAPYRGRMATYRAELGNRFGECVLWLAAEGSPTTGAEIAGYASSSPITMRWSAEGLPAVKRTTVPDEPWDAIEEAYADGLSGEDLHQYYLKATSGHDTPLIHKPITVTQPYLDIDLVADTHFGPRSMDYPRWWAWTERVRANPELRWGHLGDWCGLGKVGTNTATDPEIVNFEQCRDDLIPHTLQGIVGQNLFVVKGNHDARLARALNLDVDWVRDMCARLRLHYAGYERLVVVPITDGEYTEEYVLYVHHGMGGGRAPGHGLRLGGRLAEGNDADAYIFGHLHTEEADRRGRRHATSEGIEVRYHRTIVVPSFQRHLTGTHSANIGLPPKPLGHRTIRLHLHEHKVTIIEE